MKILVLCDEGNNRSVTLAHQLKYWNHDVIAAGVKRNSPKTLQMLCDWADRIVLTDNSQIEGLVDIVLDDRKIQVWNIGPDKYPRPFNKELLAIVRNLMTAHAPEYKPR